MKGQGGEDKGNLAMIRSVKQKLNFTIEFLELVNLNESGNDIMMSTVIAAGLSHIEIIAMDDAMRRLVM